MQARQGFAVSVARRAAGCLAGVALLSAACSSDSKKEHYLGLERPERGLQVRNIGTQIGPGEDAEWCEVAELPGDPGQTYYVDKVEVANAPFSHHLFVSTAIPGSKA